jgi:hypothetical protein
MAPSVSEIMEQDYIKERYSSAEYIDIDTDPITAAKWGVNAIPTFVILDDRGNEVARHIGAWPKHKMQEWMVDNYQSPSKIVSVSQDRTTISKSKGLRANMREIRARFELTDLAKSVDRRYSIVVGDGIHSERFTLAPKDQFTDHRWEMLLGDSFLDFTWASNNGEGMYVTIARQYVDPAFDFSLEAYRRGNWFRALPEVSQFRLYNPLFARPCLNWPEGGARWGDGLPFSEGDQKQFAWSFKDWETKIEETDVQYTVKRLSDSDNYKEFLIRLD